MSRVVLAGLLAFVGLTPACAPEVPAHPTYTSHVKAIFDAHCVRCHGQNDTLNMPPPETKVPVRCYLQRYENTGDCNASPPTTCKMGAGAGLCYGLAAQYVVLPEDADKRMPPKPSEPLNDWEKDVITKWVTDKAPQ